MPDITITIPPASVDRVVGALLGAMSQAEIDGAKAQNGDPGMSDAQLALILGKQRLKAMVVGIVYEWERRQAMEDVAPDDGVVE